MKPFTSGILTTAAEPSTIEALASGAVRVRGVGYTGGAMSVGFGEKVVIDLAGLQISAKTPLLADHINETPYRLGEVAASIVKGALVFEGEIQSMGGLAQGVKDQLANGAQWQASVGVQVHSMERVEEGEVAVNGRTFAAPLFVARKSELRELSVVAVGADSKTSLRVAASWAALGRDIMSEENRMEATQTVLDAEPVVEPDVPAVPKVRAKSTMDIQAADGAAVVRERTRVAQINAVCGKEHADIAMKAQAEGWDEATTTKAVLNAVRASRSSPGAVAIGSGRPALTPDVIAAGVSMGAGISDDVLLRDLKRQGKNADQILQAALPLQRLSRITEVMELAARAEGIDLPMGRGSDEWIRAAFSTVSLPGIFSNVANKRVMQGFSAQQSVAAILCAPASLNDFKESTRYRLNIEAGLQPLAPTGEIQHATVSEESATNQLDTYARMLQITRKDLNNDDLGVFLGVANSLGVHASRKRDELFFARLVLNTGSFFGTANGNYADGADTAFSYAALNTASRLFEEQTDANGNPIAVSPRFLVVPPVLKREALRATQSDSLLAAADSTGGSLGVANPFRGDGLTVISTSYLSNARYGNSQVAWYLWADPAVIPTFEIAYLRGQQAPTIERGEADAKSLGIWFRVYYDLGVREQEHRGAVKMLGETAGS